MVLDPHLKTFCPIYTSQSIGFLHLGGSFPIETPSKVTLIQLYWKLEPTHPNQPPRARLAICQKNQLLKFIIPLTERE